MEEAEVISCLFPSVVNRVSYLLDKKMQEEEIEVICDLITSEVSQDFHLLAN